MSYDEDDVRDARGAGWDREYDGRRRDNGDDDFNRRRARVEKLPAWARSIEMDLWGPAGGLARGGDRCR